jgi:hypothetical protein
LSSTEAMERSKDILRLPIEGAMETLSSTVAENRE